MKAADIDVLLLAAGKGERLRPLTDSIPKPLVPVGGKPLIAWNLEMLKRSGCRRVFINLHYRGQQIRDYVGNGSAFGLEVEYSEEPVLLDTGGAIKNIEGRLASPYLVTVNSDILVGHDFDVSAVIDTHANDPRKPLATLVLRPDKDAESFGILEIDDTRRIVRFLDVSLPAASAEAGSPAENHAGLSKSENTEVVRGEKLIYIGVQVVSRHLIADLPPQGTVFSITRDVYRKLVREGECLAGARYAGYWSDVGTPDRLAAASKWVAAGGG